jgi:CheY-like chemotaxis protein
VVDDDRDLRELLSVLIEAEHFAAPDGQSVPVAEAENGRNALALVCADGDVRWIILLDLRMPKVDGMQVWQVISADAALAARCAVALMTADDAATVAELQRRAGAPPLTTVFHKPYAVEPVLHWTARQVTRAPGAALE